MQTNDNDFIQQQANDWLVKLETGAMNAGDEERFVSWIEQSEQHGLAFQQAEQTWQLMHRVDDAQLQPSSSHQTVSKEDTRRGTWWSIASVFIVMLLSAFWWQDLYIASTADHLTATGERSVFTLSDGSEITLNTDSAIQLSLDNEQRVVTILEGEMYVEVAPDAQRPFIVQAGDMKVTALGTAFIVRYQQEKSSVVVTEHSVKVEAGEVESAQAIVEQGQRISWLQDTERLTHIESVNTAHANAWRQGKLVFQEQTLEYVINELDRYYPGKIFVTDKASRLLTISGVLDTEQPLEALQELTLTIPIKINQITPYLVLVENRY